MKIITRLEIHFYQQDEVAVFFENNALGEDESFAELLTYALFTARTLVNLNNNPQGIGLIAVLEKIFQDPDEFFRSELGSMPKIVDYRSNEGRKSLIVTTDYDKNTNRVKFWLKTKGFGLLGRGLNYYSPIAVTTLFRYLINRRKEDREFLVSMVSISSTLGTLMYGGNLKMTEQHNVALKIAQSCMEKLPK